MTAPKLLVRQCVMVQAIMGLEFLVYTLRTTSGQSASMFGFAGRSSLGSGHLAAASLRPFLIGRNALDREAIWHDWRVADRWWHHLPIYSFGPIDCCLWLLAAQDAGQPLWRYIGGANAQVPVYASSLVLPDATAYATEAVAVRDAGMKAYKIHPPGHNIDEDIEVHAAVRAAVGSDFNLMSDPVAPYTLEEAIRFGRALEALDYAWLEEPMPDENFSALKEFNACLRYPNSWYGSPIQTSLFSCRMYLAAGDGCSSCRCILVGGCHRCA